MLRGIMRWFEKVPEVQEEVDDERSAWMWDKTHDPLLRDFELLEATAKAKARDIVPEDVPNRVGILPQSGVADAFDEIDPALRDRALLWMKRAEILAFQRAGRLEDRVEYLEYRNNVKPSDDHTIVHTRGRFEGHSARPGEDATVGYAESFRDDGRFGSHPSHDDYGDEGRA
jgi:hypothetical protein